MSNKRKCLVLLHLMKNVVGQGEGRLSVGRVSQAVPDGQAGGSYLPGRVGRRLQDVVRPKSSHTYIFRLQTTFYLYKNSVFQLK
jgi:hypothetical protein